VPRTSLIDTDTASDDAVALIMALRAPDVRVVAITTVGCFWLCGKWFRETLGD